MLLNFFSGMGMTPICSVIVSSWQYHAMIVCILVHLNEVMSR